MQAADAVLGTSTLWASTRPVYAATTKDLSTKYIRKRCQTRMFCSPFPLRINVSISEHNPGRAFAFE
jgi:hypothetical protein